MMEKIDWLVKAREQFINLQGSKACTPADHMVQGYLAVIACIAMHNAERERGQQHISIIRQPHESLADEAIRMSGIRGMQNAMRPEQPQPFDCYEAARQVLCSMFGYAEAAWSDNDLAKSSRALDKYVRSLGYPVKE